jgi:hypothetical protein
VYSSEDGSRAVAKKRRSEHQADDEELISFVAVTQDAAPE